MIEHDNYQSVNQGILDEMGRVDWQAEHRRSGRAEEANDRYLEDIFITTELVPSSEAILSAFVHGCEQIAEESEWDLVNNEIRVSDLWAHVTPRSKNTQRHPQRPDRSLGGRFRPGGIDGHLSVLVESPGWRESIRRATRITQHECRAASKGLSLRHAPPRSAYMNHPG
jgi:hypothetical protein